MPVTFEAAVLLPPFNPRPDSTSGALCTSRGRCSTCSQVGIRKFVVAPNIAFKIQAFTVGAVGGNWRREHKTS